MTDNLFEALIIGVVVTAGFMYFTWRLWFALQPKSWQENFLTTIGFKVLDLLRWMGVRK